MSAGETITRRNLPHWYMPGAAHFVTYRLADTLPAAVLAALRAEQARDLRRPVPAGVKPSVHRLHAQKKFFARLDAYLDRSRERTWLAHPPIAALVRESLYHHDGTSYHLLAYCVMPNHVHVLLQPIACAAQVEACDNGEMSDADSPLAKIMQTLKGYTAHRANALLARHGAFWQSESYDHWVRDEDELERIVNYIAHNPVKADLAPRPQDWFFCSAHDRLLRDGSESAWLPSP